VSKLGLAVIVVAVVGGALWIEHGRAAAIPLYVPR
jgi:hypothetical protein